MAREAVRWRDSFSVGDPHIDDQHRQFFADVEAVLDAIERGAGMEALIAFYRDFHRALTGHFHDEEALLERTNFAGLAEHQAEHRALLDSVGEIEAGLAVGRAPIDMGRSVHHVFMALVEHLVGVDMQFKAHLLATRQS